MKIIFRTGIDLEGTVPIPVEVEVNWPYEPQREDIITLRGTTYEVVRRHHDVDHRRFVVMLLPTSNGDPESSANPPNEAIAHESG